MSNKRFIILLILIALISGIGWGWVYGNPYPMGDGTRHDKMALLILDKGLFNDGQIMDRHADKPVYPVFLALIYSIFGHNYQIVRIIQVLLFILLVLLVYKLCQMLFNQRIAVLASLITALCYSIASYIGWFYRELFFCFMVFLMVYCLCQAQFKNKNIWFVFSGLVTGLAVLTNAILQFFPLIIIVNFLIVGWKEKWQKIYPRIIMFFLGLLLIVMPWSIHSYLNFNYLPFGIKGSDGGGLLMQRVEKMKAIEGKYIQHLVGNTLGDFFAYKIFPDYNPKEARLGWQTQLSLEKAVEEGQDIKILNQVYGQKAKKEILKHPLMFLKMSSIDFLKFNTPLMPNVRMQHMFVGTHQELSDFTKGVIILFIRFVYLLFFIFIVYAMVKNIRSWVKVSWLFLIVLYFNLLFSNIHAIARYSVPVYPFYIILSSIGILIFWDKIKEKIRYRLK